uniref:Uncharacterized protein n=1 Tax=Ciona savignyi TaxID=51511 RepID=H2ZCB8_CIOSA
MGRFNRFNGVLATIQVFGIRMAYPMDFPFTLPPRPDILQD